MSSVAKYFLSAGCLFVLFLSGCGESGKSVDEGNVVEIGHAALDFSADQSPDDAVEPPKSADAAVRAVIRGLENHNLRAVWDFLPSSYQNDVNDVVHEFAAKADAQLWNGLFSRIRSIVELLRTKKEFILSHPRLLQNENLDLAELERNWDPTLAICATLLESEIADLERLKTVDMGSFLDQTGGRVMSQLAEISKLLPNDPFNSGLHQQLSATEVELLRSEGDTAVVKLASSDLEMPPTEVEFVRVEGKWIPQSMAEGWQSSIEQVRQQIAVLATDQTEETRADFQMIFSQFDAVIGGLQNAETADEFHQLLAADISMLSLMFGGPALGGPSPSPLVGSNAVQPDDLNRPGDAASNLGVTIVIAAKLEEKNQDTLCNQLNAIVESDDLALSEMPVYRDGKTSIHVSPVADVSAYAKRIDFAKVVNVDAAARTITIEFAAKK